MILVLITTYTVLRGVNSRGHVVLVTRGCRWCPRFLRPPSLASDAELYHGFLPERGSQRHCGLSDSQFSHRCWLRPCWCCHVCEHGRQMGILDTGFHFHWIGCACLRALLFWTDAAEMESFGENFLDYRQVICEIADVEGKLYGKSQGGCDSECMMNNIRCVQISDYRISVRSAAADIQMSAD